MQQVQSVLENLGCGRAPSILPLAAAASMKRSIPQVWATIKIHYELINPIFTLFERKKHKSEQFLRDIK